MTERKEIQRKERDKKVWHSFLFSNRIEAKLLTITTYSLGEKRSNSCENEEIRIF